MTDLIDGRVTAHKRVDALDVSTHDPHCRHRLWIVNEKNSAPHRQPVAPHSWYSAIKVMPKKLPHTPRPQDPQNNQSEYSLQ